MSTSSSSSTSSVTSGNFTANGVPVQNISGLASGLDDNEIITELMSIEEQPLTHMQQQQAVEQTRQTALQSVQTTLTNLQTSIQALTDPTLWGDQQQVSSSDTNHLTVTRTGGAAAGGYEITVSQLARAQQLTQSTSTQTASASGTLTIQVGSGTAINVNVNAGDDLQTVANNINGSSGSGVYATVINGQIVLSGKSTGSTNTISVTGSEAADFGFTQSQAAQDAKYTIDGTQKTSASNVVTDGMAGVTLTLQGVTSDPVTVTVSTPQPNTDAINSAVQNFVSQYNSTIDQVTGILNEAKVANPQSTSDMEQGVLNSDPGLEQMLSDMREAVGDMFASAPGGLQTMSQIGLSTGAAVGTGTISQDSLEGKLTLNTDTLDDALANNYSAVKSMFTNSTGTYGTEGMAQRLSNLVTAQVNPQGVLAGRISSEASIIADLQQQQTDLQTNLQEKETTLRNKFTAMETAMSQEQSIAGQLSGQIAGLGGG